MNCVTSRWSLRSTTCSAGATGRLNVTCTTSYITGRVKRTAWRSREFFCSRTQLV